MSDPLAREHYVWQADHAQTHIRGTRRKVKWIEDGLTDFRIMLLEAPDQAIRAFLCGDMQNVWVVDSI